jgi:hypothetical protein
MIIVYYLNNFFLIIKATYYNLIKKKNFQDSTFEFEKRRNVPVRYDRELVATTVKAMKRISEIKAKRERVFYKNRY